MATNIHTRFFDAFPKINYDINRNKIFEQTENVTNIFFRVGIIKKVLNNMAAYYAYTVEDNDTPEIVAEKNYGDPNAGWVVLYTNQIFDPQFDWPLGYNAFDDYVSEKYGSLENAVKTVHHIEKVTTRLNLTTDVSTETRHIITARRLTDFDPGVHFDYYAWQGNIAPWPESADIGVIALTGDTKEQHVDWANRNITTDRDTLLTEGGLSVEGTQSYIVIDGDTIVETVRADVITNYDYENELNEKRKHIKIIKPMYYGQIQDEFNKLTGKLPSFVRRLS